MKAAEVERRLLEALGEVERALDHLRSIKAEKGIRVDGPILNLERASHQIQDQLETSERLLRARGIIQ